MNRQQSSQLPSIFQNGGFPASFAPLSQTIPDLMYRGSANSFPLGSASSGAAAGHPLFLPGLFSSSSVTTTPQSMLPSPVSNPLYSEMFGAASMFYGSQHHHHQQHSGAVLPNVSHCIDSGARLLHQSHQPYGTLLPMLGSSPILNASNILQQQHQQQLQNMHNASGRIENPIMIAANHYNSSPAAHQSPTTSSLSSMSIEAKHSEKSPYSVQQPSSHGDTGSGASLTGNSPLNMSPAFRQRVNSSNRTPSSLTGASPQTMPVRSPTVAENLTSKKSSLMSPKSLNLHNIIAGGANCSEISGNFAPSQNYSQNSRSHQHQLNANNIATSSGCNNNVTNDISSDTRFDPSELESNGFFTHNVDPSLTTAVDEALSVLGKDVNLDLDAIAPNVVNQQFWEDLGDSVLDDALLGTSTSVDDSSLVGTSLLHSVFEFNSLHPTTFDDMVSPSNAGSTCSFAEPVHPTSPPPHQQSVGSSSASLSASFPCAPVNDTSMTPKLKEKMKRKEREIAELAEIDRDFARHLNMVVEKNERSCSVSLEYPPANVATSIAGKESSSGDNASVIACYSSDLYFTTTQQALAFGQFSSSDLPCSSKTDDNRIVDNGRAVSPIRFSPVREFDDRINLGQSSSPIMSAPLSSFLSLTNFSDQLPSTSGTSSTAALTNNDLLNVASKMTPRKSRKVPIYKQNCAVIKPNIGSAAVCSKNQSHNTLDSPYSFTDDEEEINDVSVEPNFRTSVAPSAAFITPKRELTPNLGEIVKEKLVEEEVQRKLIQISSLHPELRLDVTTKDPVHMKTRSCSSVNLTAKSAQNFATPCAAAVGNFSRQMSATSDDMLRHVVPKKRFSASSRGSVNSADMTPKSSLFNLHNATTTANSISSSISSCIASVSGISNDRKINSFVKTEIILDNETAKPSSLLISHSQSESTSCGISKTDGHVILSAAQASSSDFTNIKPLEHLKPKLIIRIPKQCLGNLNVEKHENNCLLDKTAVNNNVIDKESNENHRERKHKHKRKHKRKHKKHRKHSSEEGVKRKSKKKYRHEEDSKLPGIKLTLANGVFSLKRKITCRFGDECQGSFSGDDNATSPTKSNQFHLGRQSTERNSEDVQTTKNCKKMRWLNASQATINNPGVSLAVDGPSVSNFSLNGISSDLQDVQKPLLSQLAVFNKGAFVVCKEDITKNECPLWKVDSQNLLQKFLPVNKDGKTVYQGSSTYAGWCIQNQDLYVPVKVKLLHFNRTDSLVELESSLLDLFPAVSTEINDNK